MGIVSSEHHRLSDASNWTPEILAALSLSRTTELRDKVAKKASRVLREQKIDSDTLFDLWLKAKGRIRFWQSELTKYFWDNYKFSHITDAIGHALIFLCMRVHLENLHQESQGMNQIAALLDAREQIKNPKRWTSVGTKKKAA